MNDTPMMTLPDGPIDIRLIASDMDGTLLDGNSKLPDEFWPLMHELAVRDIAFVPASGRQLATLDTMFSGTDAGHSYIAENGSIVTFHGQVVSTTCIDMPTVNEMIDVTRRVSSDGSYNLGLVVCGQNSAYVERTDAEFYAEAHKYYAQLEVVDDLKQAAAHDNVLKLATYDFTDISAFVDDQVPHLRQSHQVAESSRHWVDMMNPVANKGRGLTALQESLGIGPEHTVVFGDFLNDLELFDHADYSYAMANAHPDATARARYRAPSNIDHGVMAVVRALLAL